MPEISVIVPIYNTEKYLPACLDALLAQTAKDIEVISVNNGSTDGCEKILEEYATKDSRIRVITKAHGDIYTARNAGLHAAVGDWIAFCDSDDTLPPNAYKYMLKRAKKTMCDVVVGNYIELDEKNGALPRALPRRDSTDFNLLLHTTGVWNKMIKHGFLLKHSLEFSAIPMGEDMVFLAKLLQYAPRIEYVNRTVYYYWHHRFGSTPSVTHRYSLKWFQEHIRCHRMVYDEMQGTQYHDNAAEYVYFSLTMYLKEFLPRVWDCTEREECFVLFRDHILKFDWTRHEARFLHIVGVPFSEFRSMSAEVYLTQITGVNHRQAVLEEYRVGMIGFRYILAYVKAWIGFKMKKIGHEI